MTALDIANLRRTVRKTDYNLDIRLAVEENVDLMFNPKTASDDEIKDACIHYSPLTLLSKRLEVIISTERMRDAAWKYGHKKLILIDGTFGISIQKILLFVVLAIDENNKGIPLAMIHFSAPAGNKQTAAGYNSAILEKLLRLWKERLEQMYPGKVYKPLVWTMACEFFLFVDVSSCIKLQN